MTLNLMYTRVLLKTPFCLMTLVRHDSEHTTHRSLTLSFFTGRQYTVMLGRATIANAHWRTFFGKKRPGYYMASYGRTSLAFETRQ